MKKLLLIINPLAGKRRATEYMIDILKVYKSEGYITTVFLTGYKGDAYNYISNLDESYDHIVCCGGDGTLNEVVSAIITSNNIIPLGYIPLGSTNDFAKSIGLTNDMKNIVYKSCSGNSISLDVGRLNEYYFVYVAGFGAFTKTSYATPQKLKNILGNIAYFLQGVRELSELKAYHVTIKISNNTISGDFLIGLVMNSFSIGGFTNPVNNDIRLDDGVFEIILVRYPKSIFDLEGIARALIADLRGSKDIIYFQAAQVSFESGENLDWTIDGEYGGGYTNTEISALKQRINILI